MDGGTDRQTDRQTDGQETSGLLSYFALIFVSPSLHMWKQRRENLATHPWDLGEDCARIAWGWHRRSGIGSTPRIMARVVAVYASVDCPNLRSTNAFMSRRPPNGGPSDEAEVVLRRRWITWESGALSTTLRSRGDPQQIHTSNESPLGRRGGPVGPDAGKQITDVRNNSGRVLGAALIGLGARTSCSSCAGGLHSYTVSAPSAACTSWLAASAQAGRMRAGRMIV